MAEFSDEVVRIAKGLTRAQRRMVLTNDRGFADHYVGHWHGATIATGAVLYRLGLVEQPLHLTRPTEKGLSVRQYLETNRD